METSVRQEGASREERLKAAKAEKDAASQAWIEVARARDEAARAWVEADQKVRKIEEES